MMILKTAGLMFILLSCSALGLIKADALKKRGHKLESICLSLEKLYQLVENSPLESDELIVLSFGVTNPRENTAYLKPEDTEILNRFLGEFGMGDREKECRNISLYKTIFEKKLQVAD